MSFQATKERQFTKLIVIALQLLFFLVPKHAHAQPQGQAAFEKLSHNFGRIAQGSSPISYRFSFVNKGRAPIKILKVQPSCDCTASDWTISPVAIKDTGMVEITLDPSKLSGKFSKYVTVLTNGTPQAVLLKVEGEVVSPQPKVAVASKPAAPKPAEMERYYPHKNGNLRFSQTSLFFGDVPKEGKVTKQLTIYNPSQKTIEVYPEQSNLPNHIDWSLESMKIFPYDSLQILLTFHEKKRKDWGYVHSSLFLATSDPEDSRKRLDLSARIIEDFGEWEPGDPRPVAVLDKSRHDFGTLIQNSKVSTVFKLSNRGNLPLYIRKTKASCGCTASEPQKSVLAPGESTDISLTYRSGTDVGYQKKSVTIITNDPEQTELVIWIDAHVH